MSPPLEEKKLRVAVLYGGRSGEHEVSLQSAASVIRHLDRNRFEVIPIGIDKNGKWLLNNLSSLENIHGKELPILKGALVVALPSYPTIETKPVVVQITTQTPITEVDLFFPVIHGPLCEDGSIQGLFELADVPYVGAGVLGSAVGMDKDVAKRLIREAGLSIVPYLAIRETVFKENYAKLQSQVLQKLGLPVFVKPANLGSSVGVHKVKEIAELEAAIRDAFAYDRKVLVEKAISGREIEVSVLENLNLGADPLVSIPGEVIPQHEFYSYEAKYLDEKGALLKVPADLTSDQIHEVQKIAQLVFLALECEGMARVDLFLDQKSGKFYFNEVNTIPGFTSISMYPKMWEASGIPYQELLSRLIDLAMARHTRKKALIRCHTHTLKR